MRDLEQYGYPGIKTAVKSTSLQCMCCSRLYNETQKTLKLPFFPPSKHVNWRCSCSTKFGYLYTELFELIPTGTDYWHWAPSGSQVKFQTVSFLSSILVESFKNPSSNIWLHTATEPNPLGGDAEEQHSFLSPRTQVWARPPWPIHRPSRGSCLSLHTVGTHLALLGHLRGCFSLWKNPHTNVSSSVSSIPLISSFLHF